MITEAIQPVGVVPSEPDFTLGHNLANVMAMPFITRTGGRQIGAELPLAGTGYKLSLYILPSYRIMMLLNDRYLVGQFYPVPNRAQLVEIGGHQFSILLDKKKFWLGRRHKEGWVYRAFLRGGATAWT